MSGTVFLLELVGNAAPQSINSPASFCFPRFLDRTEELAVSAVLFLSGVCLPGIEAKTQPSRQALLPIELFPVLCRLDLEDRYPGNDTAHHIPQTHT